VFMSKLTLRTRMFFSVEGLPMVTPPPRPA
jgi:hypothetical protein